VHTWTDKDAIQQQRHSHKLISAKQYSWLTYSQLGYLLSQWLGTQKPSSGHGLIEIPPNVLPSILCQLWLVVAHFIEPARQHSCQQPKESESCFDVMHLTDRPVYAGTGMPAAWRLKSMANTFLAWAGTSCKSLAKYTGVQAQRVVCSLHGHLPNTSTQFNVRGSC